jgi:hypothetical protein
MADGAKRITCCSTHSQTVNSFFYFILFYFIYLLLVLFESSRDHHARTFYGFILFIYLFYFILFSPSLTANMGVNRLAAFPRWFACQRNFGYSIPIPTVRNEMNSLGESNGSVMWFIHTSLVRLLF